MRNPGRTAATAAALMIGLTLVTTVAVLGQGLRATATKSVQRQIVADYVVTSGNGFDLLPPAVGEQIGRVPGVESSSVRSDKAKVLGKTASVTGLDQTTIERFYRFRFSESEPHAVTALGRGGAIVRKSFADTHHLAVGDSLRMLSPSGKSLRLHVSGVLDQGKFDLDPLLGTVMISQASFDRSFPRPADLYTFVNAPPVAPAVADRALAQGAERFPGAKISTRDEFVASRSSGISQILNLLYVLLALSVVVSLFGMVNTLVLAVFERTRELGMLRAIGLTRRQTRRMIRHESVVTALIGAVLGIVVGLILAGLLTARIDFIQFVIPVPQLVIFAVVAVVVGIFAAVFPARRAARLKPLDALHYE
jgi:putative ABC transport system permease protein